MKLTKSMAAGNGGWIHPVIWVIAALECVYIIIKYTAKLPMYVALVVVAWASDFFMEMVGKKPVCLIMKKK